MRIIFVSIIPKSLKKSEEFQSRGGHLGIFWVGVCCPGLQIGTLFKKKCPLKLYPVLEMGQFFIPHSRIRPKTDTPF